MRYILLLLLLFGCAPRVVKVPVPVPCAVPAAPAQPHWPIADLTGKESYGDVLRAFGASLEAEHGYAQELELILNGMRP